MKAPTLTERDHLNMNAFLGHVLDDYKEDRLTRADAIAGLAHVMAALDQDNYAEVVKWLQQGRKLISRS